MADDIPPPPPGPPSGPPLEPPRSSLPLPPPSRPDEPRPAPLAFGSRPLVLAIGTALLVVAFVAGVLGYRDHRNDSGTRRIATAATTTAPVQSEAATTCKKPTDIPSVPGKPTDIPVPDKPVTALRIRDLKKGTGTAVTSDQQLTVQYVGISCTSGKQFDSSWDSKKPLSVALDRGSVIAGWDQGIKGMKVGGRRLLWIPASLGYGDQGQPPDIPPGDTLIFVIDLLKVA